MKLRLNDAAIACCAVLLMVSFASAAELTADDIVNKTNGVAYYQGDDGRAMVSMSIMDNQGRTTTRQFIILRRDVPSADGSDGDQKFYVYFRRPADLNKMVFLVWKHANGDDDRWLYTPALDNYKRIAASDKRTSFVGSHFFYEDVSGRNVNDDHHELLDTTENYYVLKNTPKDTSTVEFAYYKMWIHRGTFLTTKVEYYDNKGNVYRTYSAEQVQTIQDFPTVTKARMKDMRLKGETVLEYDKVEYNINVPDDLFTERNVRRAPRNVLR